MSAVAVRRTGVACLSLVAIVVLVALARVTASAPPPPPVVLEACINPGNGNMRLIAATIPCHSNETRVNWNVEGPAGPIGPIGPIGPAGPQGAAGADGANGADGVSAGGPPYIWVCTPASLDYGATTVADLHIFNGGTATATLSSHFLAKNGTNLAGGAIPTSSPTAYYPGETGTNTVTLASKNTLTVQFQSGGGYAATDNNLVASIEVTSDQPIVVGMQPTGGGPQLVPCSALPR